MHKLCLTLVWITLSSVYSAMGNKAAVISSLFNYPVRSAFFCYLFGILQPLLAHLLIFYLFFSFAGQDYAGQVTSPTGKEKIIILIRHIRLVVTFFLSIL